MSRRHVMRMAVAAMIAAGVLAVLSTAACADAREENIPLHKLPRNVVVAVKKACPVGTMLSAEREIEVRQGKVFYEYEVKVRRPNGHTVKVEVLVLRATGKVTQVRVEKEDDDEDDDD